jgi:crossover junction endodeoxyribonuclease RusA
MSGDDGLLMWQRLALKRGEPIDMPPRRRNVTGAAADAATAPLKPAQESGNEQPGSYRIDLSYERPPLRSNGGHGNRYVRARIARDLIDEVMAKARALHIPACQHLTIQLHYAPGRCQRIDSHNLHPTVKPAVDALARPARKVKDPRHAWRGLSLVPDDTDEYVTILTPKIHFPPEPGPRCWLTITIPEGDSDA